MAAPGVAEPPAAPLATPLPAAAAPAEKLGAVLASALNVRPQAGTGERALPRHLHCGDVVAIDRQEGDWYHVKLDDLEGWSHVSYIVEVEPGRGRRPHCEFEHRGDKMHPDPPAGAPIVQPSSTPPKLRAATKPAPPKAAGSATPLPKVPNEPTPPEEDAKALPPPPPAKVTPPPQTVTLAQNSQLAKAVFFPHAIHVKSGLPCLKCHHPLGSSGANEEKRCHDCHSATSQRVKSKDAFHGTCRPCHEATGKGPTKCGDCHTGK